MLGVGWVRKRAGGVITKQAIHYNLIIAEGAYNVSHNNERP